jgi:UDPglucose 6-dehydrogenase/GDP-mannose 6-dehydrogenase
MRISIIGTGYVGLVSGACLADAGHQVACVDLDLAKVNAINAGLPTIHESGLPEMLARTAGKLLRATTDLRQAVIESDVTFIAVGTPARDGRIDLGQVRAAAAQIGSALQQKGSYHVVVVKSTVVPGTTNGLVRTALEADSGLRAGRDFGLGMNPEFLTEGRAVADFMRPDRIVIGGIDGRTQDAVAAVYASFQQAPRILTNNTTAEFIKYASNAVLATMISFTNELSRLCAAVGDADIVDVMKGVHESGYFTTRDRCSAPVRAAITGFLEAGCGFGGSCLPKDVTALVGQARDFGVESPLLAAVLDVNRTQPEEMIRRLLAHYPDPAGMQVTLLGLAFKPDTDDIRESPALVLIHRLLGLGAIVTVFDPVARLPREEIKDRLRIAGTFDAALDNAAAILLVTRWVQFDDLADRLNRLGRDPLIIDGRRVLNPASFVAYEGIGRKIHANRESQ